MSNNVITITRQFGSLGRKIGKEVAEKMGYKYYDRDIIEEAAARLGMNINEIGGYDGQDAGYGRMIFPLGYGNESMQKKLFEIEKSIIIEHARYEDCVVVGRAADYILKDKRNMVSVYIYAPYEERILNCIDELRLTASDAVRYINRVDKARSALYKAVSGNSFETSVNRHLMIDSTALGIDGTADMIANFAKRYFKRINTFGAYSE